MKKKVDPLGNSKIKVPFFLPNITSTEKKNMIKILDSNLLTNGPNLVKFEEEFKKYTKSKFSIGVSNATSALHLSLIANGIKKGDEVIIPDITFAATANTVLMNGAKPVFADVNLDDYNININSIKKNISKKTKAIIPVHFAGNPCNMSEILKIAKKFKLKIIEDCAHSIGSFYRKKHVGTFGESGCFSFYPTKNITTLEGGMIICRDKTKFEFMKTIRNHGITKSLKERYQNGLPWEYDIEKEGYNYRMDELRANLGYNQLKRIKKINQLRKNASDYYTYKLKDVEGLEFQNIQKNNTSSYHLYVIRIKEDFGISRNDVFRKLLKKGIQTSVHYKPLHMFSIFKNFNNKKLDNSKILFNEILSLPLYTEIKKEHQDLVIKELISLKIKK